MNAEVHRLVSGHLAQAVSPFTSTYEHGSSSEHIGAECVDDESRKLLPSRHVARQDGPAPPRVKSHDCVSEGFSRKVVQRNHRGVVRVTPRAEEDPKSTSNTSRCPGSASHSMHSRFAVVPFISTTQRSTRLTPKNGFQVVMSGSKSASALDGED